MPFAAPGQSPEPGDRMQPVGRLAEQQVEPDRQQERGGARKTTPPAVIPRRAERVVGSVTIDQEAATAGSVLGK
jgi:hypothetical protein